MWQKVKVMAKLFTAISIEIIESDTQALISIFFQSLPYSLRKKEYMRGPQIVELGNRFKSLAIPGVSVTSGGVAGDAGLGGLREGRHHHQHQ